MDGFNVLLLLHLSGRLYTTQESTHISANGVQFNVGTQLDKRYNLMDFVGRYNYHVL